MTLRLTRYIQIRQAHPSDNIAIEDGVTVDIDADGHIVGLEVLDASKRLSPSDLEGGPLAPSPFHRSVHAAPGHRRPARVGTRMVWLDTIHVSG